MKIAIASFKSLISASGSSDDRIIKAELEQQGVSVDVIDWQNPDNSLGQYDAIFISSTWNASDYPDDFVAWMEQCNKGRKRLINDIDVLRLGFHKDEYLNWLIGNNFAVVDSPEGSIVPSFFVKPGQSFNLKEKMEEWHGDLVIKPIVSADGKNTYHISSDQEKAEALISQLQQASGSKGVIVQPFISCVEHSGEYQLIFWEGQFSHAIRRGKGFKNKEDKEKKVVNKEDLPAGMMDFAQRLMQHYTTHYPEGVTRVRFDFFQGEKGPILSEVETIEPFLSLSYLPKTQKQEAVSRSAQALIRRTTQLKAQSILEDFLGADEARHYSVLTQHSTTQKAIIKLYNTYQEILNHLSDAPVKHRMAVQHAPAYFKACLEALSTYSQIKSPQQQDKTVLIASLDKAKNKYALSVLANDRSVASKAIRLLLAAAVNFIASFTLGVAHYIHYKQTGCIGFFMETTSERKLRVGHEALHQDIEQSFSVGL